MRQAWNQAEVLFDVESPNRLGDQAYDREGVQLNRPDDMEPGLTFLTHFWLQGRGDATLQLIDRNGQTVHRWPVEKDELFQNSLSGRADTERAHVHGSLLLPDGDVIFNLRYVGTARVDACGEVQWILNERGHHSIAQTEDGNYWISAVSQERRSQSGRYPDGFPGFDTPVWLEKVIQVNEDGKKLSEINILDVLYMNNLERHIAKARVADFKDPTHLNDVEPLPSSMADEYPLFESGDLLISLRNIDLVFVLDPESLNVKWHKSAPFIWQHDPDFIGNGWIGVFDNNRDLTQRGTMLGGSRIIALRPAADSSEVLFPTEHADPFYTETRGKWQKLDDGNMLLTESNAGRVVEVDSAGRTVWEWVKPHHVVTKASRHDLTREDVADWPCSSVDSVGTAARSN
jgi:hypothetical protein